MQLTINRTDLARGLAIASHAVSSKSTLPILANVLLTAIDGTLKITATNLEIAISCTVPATVAEAGSTTIPSRLLNDFVNALTPGKVTINRIIAGGEGISITSGAHQANIHGLIATEFPNVPLSLAGEHTTIEATELQRLVRLTAFAAANDDARPVFTAINVRFRDGYLTFAAADTFRLAVAQSRISSYSSPDILIPARALVVAARLFDKGEVSVYPALNQVVFASPDIELITHVVDGQYPKYEAIVPKDSTVPTVATVPTDLFRATIKTAAIFSNRDQSFTGHFSVIPSEADPTHGILRISSSSDEFGDTQGEVPIAIEGIGMAEILFNINYVRDGLNAINTPEVLLKLGLASTPGVMVPVGDSDYYYVLMPLYSR